MSIATFFIYLAIMAVSTYLIRVIPFVLVKHQIKNTFIRSFLHYIPYAVLTAMTIPAIFTATSSVISAAVGFAVACILALKNRSLTTVALLACVSVYVTELIISLV
ncbi:MAG TPA: branched-chain amino acid transporter [Lachnospiraceae bacterium]|nr:AzlD domain-containing protein [Eubacterium sp.]HBZ03224.1 branched-chain amino acid transporter [Lachnospiraceae bacterium]